MLQDIDRGQEKGWVDKDMQFTPNPGKEWQCCASGMFYPGFQIGSKHFFLLDPIEKTYLFLAVSGHNCSKFSYKIFFFFFSFTSKGDIFKVPDSKYCRI
jgi:hypothetical protein